MALRKIIEIDEEKCTGCGQCIVDCAEAALQIVNGKAKLIKEIYFVTVLAHASAVVRQRRLRLWKQKRKHLTRMLQKLPLGWLVVEGGKGHLSEECHLALLEQVAPLIPPEASVIFLGDGEFDGVRLQAKVAHLDWHYVCRTATDLILTEAEEEFTAQEVGLRPGRLIALPEVAFTRDHYAPVQVGAWWAKGEAQPIFLVTNMELAQEGCWWYKKRFRIETFFSDQKSRGFHLHQSHLADPDRLATLMIATCLAYIWIVYLGRYARLTGWNKVIHRTDRCDLSLFQLGLDLLEYFLNEALPIPVAFQMSTRLDGVPYLLPDEV